MNRRAVAAVTCLCLVASMLPAGALARPKPRPAAPRTGSLVLSGGVDGARFVVDEGSPDEVSGTTPLDAPLSLPPGAHTIRVAKEGYLPFSEVFDIVAGETTELEADLVLYSGRLAVDATPDGVQVQVDGKNLGLAPVEAGLSIGDHVVRLTKDGYVEEVRRVAVKTGQVTALNVKLLPVAVVEKARSRNEFWKTWWFWTIVGGVVAGAVATGVAVPLSRTSENPAKPDGQVVLP